MRALPGKREEEYRAGITPRIRCGTLEYSTKYQVPGRGFDLQNLEVRGTEIGRCCYNRVRLRATMRLFWAIALLCTSLLPLTADDPVEKRADPQAPAITIQPRTRTPTAAGETILDRRADLGCQTLVRRCA